MTIASDLFRTVTVKINDISQQLPYIVVNQADDNGKIIRFVPLDHGQKVTGFTGARLYYPPRSDNQYGDYVTGVESDGAWDFTIPVGVLSVGRVGCNLAFIDGDGETYSRNVVFLVEPAVSGVFDSEDGQQTRLDKIIGTVQDAADTAIDSVNQTADDAVERINKTASDAVESIGKAEESINESVAGARGSAEDAANSAQQASASASAAQTSERNAANSATQASQSATAAKQSETNAAESERNAASSERNAASSAEQAANIVASVSGSVTQAENAARSASQSASEAQNAVDGFGLQVGTTTTGEPGTDASVSIAKQGTKYVADFTIPQGPQGPKGDPGDLTPVAHDATLTGDGTANNVLTISKGFYPNTIDINPASKLNDLINTGIYRVASYLKEDSPIPNTLIGGFLIVNHVGYTVSQSLTVVWRIFDTVEIYVRSKIGNGSWINWKKSLLPAICQTMFPYPLIKPSKPACRPSKRD